LYDFNRIALSAIINYMNKLLIATGNNGKIVEFKELLKGIPFDITTPREAGINLDVEETGSTYHENAAIKAKAFAEASGMLALADDSGLEVDALNGEPGLLSSRYAGEGASDTDRVQFLLDKLEGVPEDKRTARFRCVIALASPEGHIEYCEGSCEGIIITNPKGTKGFGYDPVFYFPDRGKTMAELPAELKNKVSHRAAAARKAVELLNKKA
jgi:XTP/dITP diphosphohydrolase